MAKKLWILGGLLVVVLLVIYFNIPNKQASLLNDMVRLDQRYIPALVYTSQNDLDASRKAMAKLLPVWDAFMKDHKSMEVRDANWADSMEKINTYIHNADAIISDGKNLSDAHKALEPVREVMMNARARNHIDYYIDLLTQFHEPMESLVELVKGKQAKDLGDETIASLREQLGTANYDWQKLLKTKFNIDTYKFSDAKTAELKSLINTETQALSYLGEALDSQEKGAIIKAALAIKPPFVKMFKLFGDFGQSN